MEEWVVTANGMGALAAPQEAETPAEAVSKSIPVAKSARVEVVGPCKVKVEGVHPHTLFAHPREGIGRETKKVLVIPFAEGGNQ